MRRRAVVSGQAESGEPNTQRQRDRLNPSRGLDVRKLPDGGGRARQVAIGLVLVVADQRRGGTRDRDAPRLEAGVDLCHGEKTAQREAADRQQQHRRRGLAGNQQPPPRRGAAGRGCAGVGLERLDDGEARRDPQRRSERGDQGRPEDDDHREAEDAPIGHQVKIDGGRHPRQTDLAEHRPDPRGREQCDGGRGAREQDALGEQRTHDPPAIGSYRQSDGHLALAVDRAREHQMRDVDRADQQQEQRDREDAGGSESGQGLRHDGVNGRLRQRRECKGATCIRVRIPPGERVRQDADLRASLLERRVVPQPGVHPPLQLSAAVGRLPVGVVEWLPEFRREPSKQPGEPRRGNPDDRSSSVADRQLAADDPRIRPEVPAPRGVTENDHRARLVGCIERPSEWERHAEGSEVVGGDLFADCDPAVQPGAHHRSHAAVCDHGFEGGDVTGEIRVVAESHRFLAQDRQLSNRRDADDPIGCPDRERFEQHGVDGGQREGGRAHAHHEGQEGGEREPGGPQQRSSGYTSIGPDLHLHSHKAPPCCSSR